MQTLMVNNTLFYLPEDLEDAKSLIRQARTEGKTIVTRGAGHSFPMTPLVEGNRDCLHVMLTYLNKISEVDWASGRVTVQAGCHLGLDPFDPAGVSTLQNAFLFQMDPITASGARDTPPGWSVGDLGGIIHQTMGGFTATASSGGSVKYAFEDSIVAVRILFHDEMEVVDKTFHKPADGDPDDPFWGLAFAHLGLMGMVVELTLQLEPAFNIAGSETTSYVADAAIDLFGPGNANKPGLRQFLTQTEYTRLLWWPQQGIDKIVLWQARRTDAADWKSFVPQPYQEVPWVDGSPTLATTVSDAIFSFLGRVPERFEHFLDRWFGKSPQEKHKIAELVASADDWLLKLLLKIFAHPGVQHFTDIGWHGIPMDNQMSDKLMETWFTELWIPLEKAEAVMNSMKTFYADPLNAGTFCCEIYAAKKSSFWMNPAYGTDVIRLDVFWFAKNEEDPVAYFQRFWKYFAPFEYRCHWGKYLPPAGGEQGAAYLQERYPRFQQFSALRREMDPHDIFLNPYWKEHLALETIPQNAVL
ncbi:MAG: D-arabinono-1,4-lactone oxidase [Flavisolibacter sp.]